MEEVAAVGFAEQVQLVLVELAVGELVLLQEHLPLLEQQIQAAEAEAVVI
jgi:hypothetical protein